MDEKLFDELVTSLKEAAAISRGEMAPGRVTEYPEPDVRRIRKRYALSQEQFANLLGVRVGTLRNWEQGRRSPRGTARVLLRIADKHPEFLTSVAGDR
ncbi:MAG: NadS family protein [Desulfomonilaceae bacterium]|nr:NadS family protein [Desulfomonilaceae bacterium]